MFEGIGFSSVLIGIGLAAIVAFVLYLVVKFKVKPEYFSLTKLVLQVVDTVLVLIFPQEADRKRYKKFLDLLLSGVLAVEKSKSDIQQRLLVSGWNPSDKESLHKEYTNEAIKIAKELATQAGVTYDGLTEQLMLIAVKLFLSLLPNTGSASTLEFTNIGDSDKTLVWAKDGKFYPVSNLTGGIK